MAESIQIYHCGASSKDAGKRITTITRLQETEAYKGLIDELKRGAALQLP